MSGTRPSGVSANTSRNGATGRMRPDASEGDFLGNTSGTDFTGGFVHVERLGSLEAAEIEGRSGSSVREVVEQLVRGSQVSNGKGQGECEVR